jgi:hypothetical protein
VVQEYVNCFLFFFFLKLLLEIFFSPTYFWRINLEMHAITCDMPVSAFGFLTQGRKTLPHNWEPPLSSRRYIGGVKPAPY